MTLRIATAQDPEFHWVAWCVDLPEIRTKADNPDDATASLLALLDLVVAAPVDLAARA